MYQYGMGIAARYASSTNEIAEIANDGFLKMLLQINRYKDQIPFELWLRRIIINSGIDHYRKYHKKSDQRLVTQHNRKFVNAGLLKLEMDDLLLQIQQLTPAYRLVFVLYVVEGYTHAEIAEKLNIGIGTSKSNLHKAREKLKEMLLKTNSRIEEHGR